MKTFKFILLFLNLSNVILGQKNKRTTAEDLNNIFLNQGEYYPTNDFNYQFRQQLINFPQDNLQFHPGKYSIDTSDLKKFVGTSQNSLKNNPDKIAYVKVRQTKVLPVKIVQEGSTKHVYLLDSFDKPAVQTSFLRTPKYYQEENQHFNNYYKYKPTNYYKPQEQYHSNYLGYGQNNLEHNFDSTSSGYRYGKSQNIDYFNQDYQPQFSTGYADNFYQSGSNNGQNFYGTSEVVPQHFSEYNYPEYTSGKQEQFHEYPYQFNGLDSKFYTASSNIQSINLVDNNQTKTETNVTKVSSSNSEVDEVLKDLMEGKGTPTQDGFTMIKSKKENAIYLVGTPGMSLDTIPNLLNFKISAMKKSNNENMKAMEGKSR